MVPEEGSNPHIRRILDPKSGASTNSATRAHDHKLLNR